MKSVNSRTRRRVALLLFAAGMSIAGGVSAMDGGDGAFLSGGARALFSLGLIFIALMVGEYFVLRYRGARSIHELEKLLDRGVNGAQRQPGKNNFGLLDGLAQRIFRLVDSTDREIQSAQTDREEQITQAKLMAYKKARLEAALEAHPDGVVVVDQAGVTTFCNAKIEALLGLKRDAVKDRRVHEWAPNDNVIALLSPYENASSPVSRTEGLYYTPKHRPDKTVSVSCYPLFASPKSTNLIGTLVVFRDVTVEALAKQARGEFVAHVSHELKTPINILSMYSEMLMDTDNITPELTIEAVNVIHDEVERLSLLISNLLSLTKIEMGSLSLERTRVKMREFLVTTFEAVIRSARNGDIEAQINVPDEMTPVYVDKDLLRVAITNLITNAIKYNQPGGRVIVNAEENDDQIIIRVIDTGLGIAPNDRNRIFEKFYRSEDPEVRKRSGHGLGLPLAKQIIELHHGSLTFISNPGQGSEFTVTFNKNAGLLKQAV